MNITYTFNPGSFHSVQEDLSTMWKKYIFHKQFNDSIKVLTFGGDTSNNPISYSIGNFISFSFPVIKVPFPTQSFADIFNEPETFKSLWKKFLHKKNTENLKFTTVYKYTNENH